MQNLLALRGVFTSSCSELTGLAEFTGKRKARGFWGEGGARAGTEPFSHVQSEQHLEGCLLES